MPSYPKEIKTHTIKLFIKHKTLSATRTIQTHTCSHPHPITVMTGFIYLFVYITSFQLFLHLSICVFHKPWSLSTLHASALSWSSKYNHRFNPSTCWIPCFQLFTFSIFLHSLSHLSRSLALLCYSFSDISQSLPPASAPASASSPTSTLKSVLASASRHFPSHTNQHPYFQNYPFSHSHFSSHPIHTFTYMLNLHSHLHLHAIICPFPHQPPSIPIPYPAYPVHQQPH